MAVSTILAGAIAAIGMLASFHTVSTQMQPSFKGWAWTVPVTLDMSIAAFSILELALLRMALPHLLARLAVYAATAATIYLNTRGIDVRRDHAQLIAHAAMPAVWALYIELLRGGAVTLTRRERRDAEHPALALLLAPVPVLTVWRRGVLAQAATPQTREPKMSAARGHFRGADLCEDSEVDTEEERADIFPAPIPAQTAQHLPAAFHEDGAAGPDVRAAADAAGEDSQRIGKGRGLSSRHAVLDLALNHPELSGAQIAERLNLSPRTVRRHLGRR